MQSKQRRVVGLKSGGVKEVFSLICFHMWDIGLRPGIQLGIRERVDDDRYKPVVRWGKPYTIHVSATERGLCYYEAQGEIPSY